MRLINPQLGFLDGHGGTTPAPPLPDPEPRSSLTGTLFDTPPPGRTTFSDLMERPTSVDRGNTTGTRRTG